MSTTRNVFVTGAASGIGEATARLFAANGWNVMVNARRQQCLENWCRNSPPASTLCARATSAARRPWIAPGL